MSAGGLIALLEEDDPTLQAHALERLHTVVDQHWAEIANAVPLIEELSENDRFPSQQLAAAVASKCFFHLEEYNDALRLALGAGDYFDISDRSEYAETLIAKCIDEYVAQRTEAEGAEERDEGAPMDIDDRLEQIVERMFRRCYSDGRYTHAAGVALEARRIDKIEECVQQCPQAERSALLAYLFEVAQTLVTSRTFRLRVVEVLVRLHKAPPPESWDFAAIAACLQTLGRSEEVAALLSEVCDGSNYQALLGYQVAFDIVETDNQKFILDVLDALPDPSPKSSDGGAAADAPVSPPEGESEAKDGDGDAMAVDQEGSAAGAGGGATPVTTDANGAGASSASALFEGKCPEYKARLAKIRSILDAEGFFCDLTLNFQKGQSQGDPLLIKGIKEAVDVRNMVLHNAVVATHGYLFAGTTNTKFLRENLDWMSKAGHWAKFSATASIGVVHRGHVKESMTLLAPYLPQGGASASPYSEGGALYALGLIHSNRGGAGDNSSTINYLSQALKDAGNDETTQHGACLGLGLAAMATGHERTYEELKTVLYFDMAVAGEAAALAIGLLLLGRGAQSEPAASAVPEMLAYAHDTAHEKIIRGLGLALALVMFGQEEAAEGLIEQLARDRDPILRYGAMYMVGMAYAGTGNNGAVRRLLHVAVSDVSDDVRRAAVMCLGFVLFRTPERLPTLVALLAESYNPNVRYGVCLALGFACAGSGASAALALLEPMTADPVDFVRQGALLGTAFVLMQCSEARVPKVRTFREQLTTTMKDKHVSTLTKMGAVLAAGLLDAGGRNMMVMLQSNSGFTKASACVGLALWAQYWYWFPNLHFMSLALAPTMVVGLNGDLMMPKAFSARCDAKPSQFAYPKKLEEKKEEKKERVQTAVLSTTAKAKAKEKKKEAEEKKKDGDGDSEPKDSNAGDDTSKMEVDGEAEVKEGTEAKEKTVSFSGAGGADAAEAAKGDDGKEGDSADGSGPARKKEKKEAEPVSYPLINPSRVTPLQRAFVVFDPDQRYVPASRAAKPVGVVILKDGSPDEVDEELVAIEAPGIDDGDDEADMPEPFEWTAPN